MSIQKIRGHKRIWKKIEAWKSNNLTLDMQNLKQKERDYTKIRIHPYSALSILKSNIPQPKGETRKKILTALIDIYEQWDNQLKAGKEPYYLKIWLYEPNFKRSQVVCAIGSCLQFYDNSFYKPETEKQLPLESFGALKTRILEFVWEYRLEEEFLNSDDLGEPEDFASEQAFKQHQKWFESRVQKADRTMKTKDSPKEYYAFKKGVVWVGSK